MTIQRIILATALLTGAAMLAGCATALDGGQAAPPSNDAASTRAQATTLASAPALATHFHVAPPVGAPAETASALEARLAALAAPRSLSLVTADDQSRTHVVRGYLSAIADEGRTTVIFVWDVLDGNGSRVHRIQGQQGVPPGDEEGWSSVDASTLDAIAGRTAEQLALWARNRSG